MAGIQTRWVEPMVVRYPQYITWFDFPYTSGWATRPPPLKRTLRSIRALPAQPRGAANRHRAGLRPANAEVAITGADSLFTQWQAQGVMAVVPRSRACTRPTAMCCWRFCAGSISTCTAITHHGEIHHGDTEIHGEEQR
jgi:hypothetical protein